MSKLLVEVATLAQRADLRGTDASFLDYLVVKRYSTLLNRFVLQEEAIVIRKGRPLGVTLGGFNEGIAELALKVSYDLQVKLPSTVSINRQCAQRPRTVTLDELPLEHLNRPHQGLIVVRDIPHLLIQKVDSLVSRSEFVVRIELGERCGVQLFLQSHDFLLEDQD